MNETMVGAPISGAPVVTIGANFAGASYLDFGANPPDTNGAVGPNQFVELLNSVYRVYDKSGNVLQQLYLNGFWQSAGVPQPNAFDPRILYDPDSQHWFAAALDFSGEFLLAVSNTSDPTQGWQAVELGHREDFTELGVNRDGVYLVGSNFSLGIPEYFVIPKSDLLATPPTAAHVSFFGSLPPPFAPQPAVAPDLSGSEPILGAGPDGTDFLKVFSIDWLPNGPVLNTTDRTVSVPEFLANTQGATQKGSTIPIRTLGPASFSSSVVMQDDKLFGVETIALNADGSHPGLRWFEIGSPLTAPVVLDSGIISPPGLDVYFGSIAVNPLGEVVIGFSGSGPNDYPSAYAVAGMLNGDDLQFGDPILLKAGDAPATLDAGRFGDYSATTYDPTDPSHFWTVHEVWPSTEGWVTQISEIIFSSTFPPVAHNDIAGVSRNHDVSGNVLTNDTDPNNEVLTVTAVTGATTNDAGQFVAAGAYGALVLNADGGFTYEANKRIDFPDHGLAQDTFSYTATNTEHLSSQATLTVTVVKPSQTYIAGTPGIDADHLTVITGGNGKQVIDGSLGFEQINSGKGNDVIVGGPGDVLTGARGNDTFVFSKNFGANTITDFGKGHDTILLNQSHFADFAALIANAASDGHEGTLLTDPSDAGNTIDLLGVSTASLHASQFFFV
jgi:Bacterial cadherin-like domain